MVDPIPETHDVSEFGAAESLSQASAKHREEERPRPAQFRQLRHYINQMQGMILDTEA